MGRSLRMLFHLIIPIISLSTISCNPDSAGKKLNVPKVTPSAIVAPVSTLSVNTVVTKIVIRKCKNKMLVYFGDTFKVYNVALGLNPLGTKVKQGDNRTPEGTYYITYKNAKSRGYKSLKISYPNEADKEKAKALGVAPGGDICIHGLWWAQQDPKTHWKDNWTWGCVAVNNQEIDEIFNWCEVNTPVIIYP